MQYKIKRNFVNFLLSINSKKLKHRIVVFESDDWGSTRTISNESIKAIHAKGGLTNHCPYAKYDILENSSDINILSEVLLNYKDTKGNHPQITANFIMANPDFEAISKSNFKEYHYKKFDQTYLKYYPNEDIFSTLKKAIDQKVLFPQFHGREHINVPLWLAQLQEKDPVFIEAFNWGSWGIKTEKLNRLGKNMQATFDLNTSDGLSYVPQALESGLAIFEEKFGFRSKSFIPNNYIWSTSFNKYLKDLGVDYMQGIRIQHVPKNNSSDKREAQRRIPGKREASGLISLVRNSAFEPSFYHSNRTKALDQCLIDIEAAFRFNLPAVISTHRINYASGLDVKNRDENLKLIKELFQTILKKWPDVHFLNSVELGDLYKESIS